MSAFVRRCATAMLVAVGITPLGAQQPGRISGRIVDARDDQPIAGAVVTIAGTAHRTISNARGEYVLSRPTPDPVTLRITAIGYAPVIQRDIPVTDGGETRKDIRLTAQAVELDALQVSAAPPPGSVDAALDDQRYSTGIITGVSRDELARSPDGDAAVAVQRLSGATVQDGKYLFVRGLGDRYTTASLNGARIPSPEPERKVVPLDLFPTALLDGITASKTFTPDQSGDFSGAAINIRTRDFPRRTFRSLSLSSGYNSISAGAPAVFAPRASGDWLASGAGPRLLPTAVARSDFGTLSPAATNALVRSFRNVWSPVGRSGTPSAGASLTLGGNLGSGSHRLGYTVSGSYSYSEEIKADHVRALAATVASGAASEVDRFSGRTGTTSVLWGAIANASYAFGTNSRLSLNNSYNRTMDNEGRREIGSSENLALPLLVERTRYVERQVRSTQLELHHPIRDGRLTVDGGLTWSGVSRVEPDRSEVVYALDGGVPHWYGFSNEAAVRTFGDLRENSLEAHADLTLALGNLNSGRRIRIGALMRDTHRDATNTAYAISLTRALPGDAAAAAPEDLFATWSAADENYFRVAPLAAGGSYRADDQLWAGYAMYTAPLGRRFDLVMGARLEHSTVRVDSRSTAGEPSTAAPTFTDLLPSLALTWHVGENTALRGSATQTLSRPEYRELAPILYREVIGSDNVRGNADLERALIRNYDLRLEHYPRPGEVLSIGLFAKDFARPIERIYQGTSGTRIIGYVNARSAHNYGVELEVRSRLDRLVAGLANLTVFANATVMHSTIQMDPATGSMTNLRRAMVGQAPYVVNAGLTWNDTSGGLAATLLYNRVGPRISEAGESPLPDVTIRPRDVLDLSLHLPIQASLAARVDLRNLLDAPYRTSQGDVTRESYRTGRTVNVGFRWQP